MSKVTNFFSEIKSDFPAGLVVFLVAVPLCLGVALASGAPLFSGIIAGVAGGIVVALISGLELIGLDQKTMELRSEKVEVLRKNALMPESI